jgi:hypothetical protein
MNDNDLDRLRAEVGRHTGPARARPLTELGQALAQRYWQVGPGSAAGEPWLDEAIRALDEAHGYLEPGQFPRGLHGAMLGWLLGTRHVAHAGPVADGERGVVLLEEALEFPQLPPMLQIMGRIVLGQLLLSRLTRAMQSPDFAMRLMRSGLSVDERAAADRAAACFREVLERSGSNAELTRMAQTCLALAEMMQMLAGGLGGGPGGFDVSRMMQAMAGLQNLQQQATATPGGTGFGRIPNLFEFAADDLAALDPHKRPVMVVEGAIPESTPAPPPATPPTAAEPAGTFRDALHALLPGGLPDVLDSPVSATTVDRLAALAAGLADAPDATAADRLPLAVALYLRSVVDPGGGWGDEADDDLHDVRTHLLAAADGVAVGSAEGVTTAFRLARLLDDRRPALSIRLRLAASFGSVTQALGAVGADALLYAAGTQPVLLRAASGALEAAGPGLPDRIVMAGGGPVPFGPVVSVVRDGAQLVTLARRARRPVAEDALFVANPRGDRKDTSTEASLLRRRFYPGSTVLGEPCENVAGPGTPAEVRARLDASMIHLGCGITACGGMELAGPAELTADEIADGPAAATGGLAVLPWAPGAETLADALLASRCAGVIRFRTAVPDDVAVIVHVALHAELVDAGRDPAAAVAAVRRWLADAERVPPDALPVWLAERAKDPEWADPAVRDALVYHGV